MDIISIITLKVLNSFESNNSNELRERGDLYTIKKKKPKTTFQYLQYNGKTKIYPSYIWNGIVL